MKRKERERIINRIEEKKNKREGVRKKEKRGY
jgi:hypothetical protein